MSYYADDTVTVHHGDCLDVLATVPDASVDAVVTDPPYNLGFMGKEWDRVGGMARATSTSVEAAANPYGRARTEYGGASYGGSQVESMRAFQAWCLLWATECLRVLKPGGHLLAFGGTRTSHRLTCAIEDAGFEIRDSIAWLYGSGFPKSLDVSKAIDKRGGNAHLSDEIGAAIRAARESRGWTTGQADRHFCRGSTNWTWYEGRKGECRPPTPENFARIASEWPELAPLAAKVAAADREVLGQSDELLGRKSGIGNAVDGHYTVGGTLAAAYDVTAPATDAARTWQGWGTALKPAHEPVVVARKPLSGTVAQTVLEHGTGALNIDGCRVGASGGGGNGLGSHYDRLGNTTPLVRHGDDAGGTMGRWPANVVLDESQAAALDQQSGDLTSGANPARRGVDGDRTAYGDFAGQEDANPQRGVDIGGASRFFKVVSSTLDTCPLHGDASTPAANMSAGRNRANSDDNSPTAGSGNRPTDPSPTDATSTTRTTTPSTTTSPTSSSSRPKSIATTTDATARTTESSTALNTDSAAAAPPSCLCLSSSNGEQAHSRGTAASASASTSASGGQLTARDTTPTCVPIDRLAARFKYTAKADAAERVRIDGTAHPTVKPLALMRWLVRLVTPPGGTVLEPFAGSGTTVEACILEGFRCVAIEREADYLPLILQRVHRRRDPVAAVKATAVDGGLFDLLGEEPAS